MSEVKVCTKCKLEKPVSLFHKSRRGKYGVVSNCKSCCSQYLKSIYQEKKQEILERNASWRRDNKDKCREHTQKYRLKDIERARQLSRKSVAKWRAANPEKEKAFTKSYRTNNPEKMRVLWIRRQEHVRRATPPWANQFFITEAYHIAKVRNQFLGGNWHVDHIIPLRGKNVCGLHVENNLQVIRSEVNLRKGNKFFEENAS